MMTQFAPLLHHYVCTEVPSAPENRYLHTGKLLRPFDEDELEKITDILGSSIDEAWYWYAEGNYDGAGYLLMRKEDRWDLHDMGHCSCYGPIDGAHFTGQYGSVQALEKSCTNEMYDDIKPLIEMAHKAGFQ